MFKRLSKTNDIQWYYSILLSSSFFLAPIRTMFIAIGDYFFIDAGKYLGILAIIFFAIIFVLPVIYAFKTLNKDIILVGSILIIQWCWIAFFNTDNINVLNLIGIGIFIKAFPYYHIARQITDWEKAKKIIYSSSFVVTGSMVVATLFYSLRGTLFAEGFTYNQHLGIIIFPAAIISLSAFFEKTSLSHFANFSITLALVLYYGARSPLVCITIMFLILFLDKVIKRKLIKKIRVVGIVKIGLVICILAIFLVVLINYYKNSNSSDLYTKGNRIYSTVATGNFFKSDGRIEIFQAAFKIISDNPLTGTGIISDRIQIYNKIEMPNSGFQGYYAHNIFLEVICQFGIIIGGLLSLFILLAIFYGLFVCKNDNLKAVFAIYVTTSIGLLLFSGSYLGLDEFWAFFGIAYSMNKEVVLKRRKYLLSLKYQKGIV